MVAASIFPIADAVRQVGGDRVEVVTLLPAGQTPHDYRPTPAQTEKLARAGLLIVVGLGLDDWARRSAAAVGAGGPEVLDLGSTLMGGFPRGLGDSAENAAPDAVTSGPTNRSPDREHGGHDPHEHGDAAVDPHVWLDPVVMMGFADQIFQTLRRLDPAGESIYRANALRFRKELEELDWLCARRLQAVPRKEFVSLHAAFGVFAKRYGLRQLALRHTHAEEAGPRHLEEVVAFIKAHRIKTIFAEPQFPADRLEAIAHQTGATIRYLDPIGAPGVPGYDGYVALMRTNLETLVAALSS